MLRPYLRVVRGLVRPPRRGRHVALQHVHARLDLVQRLIDAREPRRARVATHRSNGVESAVGQAGRLPGEGEVRDGRGQQRPPEAERAGSRPGPLERLAGLGEVVGLVAHDAEPVESVRRPTRHVAELGAMVYQASGGRPPRRPGGGRSG